jgi:hypothetical protein
MTPRRMEAVMPISALLLPWLMGVSVPLRSRTFTLVLSAAGFVAVTVEVGASVATGAAAGGLVEPGLLPVAIIDVAPLVLGVVVGVVAVAALPKATVLGGGAVDGSPVVSAAALDGSCAGGLLAHAAAQRAKVTATMVVFMSIPLV